MLSLASRTWLPALACWQAIHLRRAKRDTRERASERGAEERRAFPALAFPFFPCPLHACCSRVTSHDFPKWRAYSHAFPTAYTPFQILMLHVVSLCSKLTNRALFSNSLNICTGRRRLLLYSTLVHQLVSTRNTCLGSKKILPLRRSLHWR